jgi:hypothetical protein
MATYEKEHCIAISSLNYLPYQYLHPKSYMSILEGALIGAAVGLVVVVVTYYNKNMKYQQLLKTVSMPVDYSGLYHYAKAGRFRKSMKFFDSFGILFLSGKNLYYKASPNAAPISFDISECTFQQEPDWRFLKWFSVTTSTGEKHYFNSHKMGLFKNDSSETLRGLEKIKSRQAEA